MFGVDPALGNNSAGLRQLAEVPRPTVAYGACCSVVPSRSGGWNTVTSVLVLSLRLEGRTATLLNRHRETWHVENRLHPAHVGLRSRVG